VARTRLAKTLFESDLGVRVLGRVASWFLRALGSTWRITVEGPDPFATGAGPHLAAFWHRNALIACFVFRDQGFSVPVSRSRDGDLITQLLVNLGYKMPPRGSSSRGGAAAFRALERLVTEEGTTISIQTDGPVGPPRVSKQGMVNLARRSGRPISPLTFSASPCIQFGSWDGTLLPLPFARVLCSYGPEILVPGDLEPEAKEEIRLELDRELNRLTDAADERHGLVDPHRPAL